MSPSEPSQQTATDQTDDESAADYIDVKLWPWQIDALFNYDQYGFVAISGGRGAGKSFLDPPFVMRLSELPKDLYFGICAPTDTMLQTVLAEVRKTVDHFGINHVYGPRAPREWREQWESDQIEYPPPRFRNDRFWIWEDGTHFFTFSLANNAYTRAKGLNMNVIYGQEFTEPGVTDDVYTTLVGCLRCGQATPQPGGAWRCVVPGHWHQIRTVFNVPLHNPSHFMYTKMRRMKAREEQRLAEGARPYFKLIQVRTQDNKATGESYLDTLRAALDEDTFQEQTSGDILHAKTSGLTYYSFSDDNILPRPDWPRGLTYDPRRELHIWFDFNKTPATSGWGHDLRPGEVPLADARAKHHFGVVGELFSDSDPMDTYRVANALIEDPTVNLKFLDARCRESECGHPMKRHISVAGSGWLCDVCAYQRETPHGKMFCSGKTTEYEWSRKYIHATPNWRGLIKHVGRIFVYGDASGKNETSSSVAGSSLKILKDVFTENLGDRVEFRFKEANPSITMRELAVNLGLRAADGTHSLFFAPWCEAHIEDCRQVVPDPKTGHAKKVYATAAERAKGNGYWQRTHSMDGASYMWDYRWPFEIPRAGAMPYAGESEPLGPFDTRWTPP